MTPPPTQGLVLLQPADRLDGPLRAAAPLAWPVVYINLASDTQRRAAMEARFDDAGVHAQRLEAVRWRELPQASQAALYSTALNARQYHLPLADGEKGCYASHLVAWQLLSDSPFEAMVVLEDDVLLASGFVERLAVLQRFDAAAMPWGMVKLISRAGERPRRSVALDGSAAQQEGSRLIAYRRIPSWTAGYVVRREAAARLLAARLPFGRPVDVDLRHPWETGVRVLGLLPNAIDLAPESTASSVNALRPKDGATRWRKLRHQWAYTLSNALHRDD